jgi:hypothetical protein
VRARRAGLSPSATSIRVLTATAVSMIVGKIHAVAELYPMTRIRSLSARKLTEIAYADGSFRSPQRRRATLTHTPRVSGGSSDQNGRTAYTAWHAACDSVGSPPP